MIYNRGAPSPTRSYLHGSHKQVSGVVFIVYLRHTYIPWQDKSQLERGNLGEDLFQRSPAKGQASIVL